MKKVLIVVVVLAVATAIFLLKKTESVSRNIDGFEWSKLASEKMNFDDAYLCYQLFSVKSRFFNLFPYYLFLSKKLLIFSIKKKEFKNAEM